MNPELSLKRYQYPALFMHGKGPSGKISEKEWMGDVTNYKEQKEVLRWLPPNKYKKILDVGASWREMEMYRYLGYDVTALVLSVDVHKELTENGFKCILADACDIPDEVIGQFDAIVSGHVVEHIFYPWKHLFELYRVLPNNGRGLIVMPLWKPEEKVKENANHDMCSLQHCSILEPFQLKAMLRVTGFKIIRHIVYPNEQVIYFDKIPLEELKSSEETYKFLTGYCSAP